MLKRNIAVLAIAGGLLGAQAGLVSAGEIGQASSVKVSYLDGRAAHDVYASGYGSDDSSGSRGSGSSPFPENNSKD